MAEKKRPTIVSIALTPPEKERLDNACDARGMTIKALLGRLIDFFVKLDKTEQSIVLGQIEVRDVRNLSELILKRIERTGGLEPARGKRSRTRPE